MRGSGNGLSLTIHAHLDTASSGVEADLPVLGEIRLGVTETPMKALEVKAETVRIIIEDVPKSNWAIAGELVSNRGES